MEEEGTLAGVLRILAWTAAAAALLCMGFGLVGVGLIAVEAARFQVSFEQVRRGVWWSLYAAVVSQALLPHLLLSLVAWLALARHFPSLERSWPSLLAGMTATAVGCFPLIGWLSFTAWTPTSARDYLATLVLIAGSTTAALALPRWLFRSLAPGAFAPLQVARPGRTR